jgi:hypothetical protein
MFGNVARARGEEFAPYLPHVVGLAFTSCRQEDGVEFVGDDSSDSDGDEDIDSDDSSDEEGGGRHFNVRTGGLHDGFDRCCLICGNMGSVKAPVGRL